MIPVVWVAAAFVTITITIKNNRFHIHFAIKISRNQWTYVRMLTDKSVYHSHKLAFFSLNQFTSLVGLTTQKYTRHHYRHITFIAAAALDVIGITERERIVSESNVGLVTEAADRGTHFRKERNVGNGKRKERIKNGKNEGPLITKRVTGRSIFSKMVQHLKNVCMVF
jgi:hypothetical protein